VRVEVEISSADAQEIWTTEAITEVTGLFDLLGLPALVLCCELGYPVETD